jgi:hypothetical protein
MYKFNNLVKKLANISGWPEYAIKVLTMDEETYNLNKESYKNTNFNKYKMASYLKYLKYKTKYLKLKNNA